MFLMKNKLVLFITGCFALVLSSCLKSEDVTDIELVKNCQISSFKLSSDSISGLDTVKFTIDQLTGGFLTLTLCLLARRSRKLFVRLRQPVAMRLAV